MNFKGKITVKGAVDGQGLFEVIYDVINKNDGDRVLFVNQTVKGNKYNDIKAAIRARCSELEGVVKEVDKFTVGEEI